MLQFLSEILPLFSLSEVHRGQATIHRLMVICKSHYVLRTIDDLFILAGADLEWCIKRVAPQGKSEREDRFNCWLYGIRDKAPQREDAILWKIASEVVRNPDVPEQQRQALNEVLVNAARIEVADNGFQLEPFLATLARMLASAGLTREVAIDLR
jgi:hypothetical protein